VTQRALRCQVAVVGGGVAGTTAARYLSDCGIDTVIMEAGGANTGSQFRSPNMFAARDDNEAWWPGTRVQLTQRQSLQPYRQGRGIGGGGAVNGMVVDAGTEADYAGWADAAWPLAQQLLQTAIESQPGTLGETFRALSPGAERTKLWLRSTASGLERRLPNLNGIRVLTNATVTRLDVGSAAGPPAIIHTSDVTIHADQVLLCAGVFGTARLTAPLVDTDTRRHIGAHVQDHPGVRFAIRLRPDAVETWRGRPTNTVINQITDAAHLLLVESLSNTADCDALRAAPVHAVLMVALTKPTDRGQLDLHTSSAYLSLLDAATDRERLRGAIRTALDVLDSPTLREVIEEVFVDDRGTTLSSAARTFTNNDALDDWLLTTAGDYSHLCGSCPAGLVTGTGTELGRVRGPANLWVGDASLFPQIPSTNPMLPTMAVAQTVAESIAANLG
jgi:choline dehydrogenase-like flavoprotein